jgi:hypothetical protein
MSCGDQQHAIPRFKICRDKIKTGSLKFPVDSTDWQAAQRQNRPAAVKSCPATGNFRTKAAQGGERAR